MHLRSKYGIMVGFLSNWSTAVPRVKHLLQMTGQACCMMMLVKQTAILSIAHSADVCLPWTCLYSLLSGDDLASLWSQSQEFSSLASTTGEITWQTKHNTLTRYTNTQAFIQQTPFIRRLFIRRTPPITYIIQLKQSSGTFYSKHKIRSAIIYLYKKTYIKRLSKNKRTNGWMILNTIKQSAYPKFWCIESLIGKKETWRFKYQTSCF